MLSLLVSFLMSLFSHCFSCIAPLVLLLTQLFLRYCFSHTTFSHVAVLYMLPFFSHCHSLRATTLALLLFSHCCSLRYSSRIILLACYSFRIALIMLQLSHYTSCVVALVMLLLCCSSCDAPLVLQLCAILLAL
jgi:hypothetical protein